MSVKTRLSIRGQANAQSLKGKLTVSTVLEDNTQVYILVDEDGREIPAVLVDEPVELTATANDIREGTVAVTEEGVITGEKFIPPYYTTAGWRAITIGGEYKIPLPVRDAYDYTEMQCILCTFNEEASKSVASDKVVIGNFVYPVNSTSALSELTKNANDKTVYLGITNDTGSHGIIRYFTYKEEQ